MSEEQKNNDSALLSQEIGQDQDETNEDGYRREAVLEYATAQQNYHLIRIITPRVWIILIAAGLFLVTSLSWFFFGTIVTRVKGQGVFIEKTGSLHGVSFHGTTGYVQSIEVEIGQKIKKGDVLGIVDAPNLENTTHHLQKLVNEIQTQYDNLSRQSLQAIQTREKQWMNERTKLNEIIGYEQNKIKRLQPLLEAKKQASEKGIVSKEDLINTEIQYSQLAQNVLNNQAALSTMDADFDAYKENWNERVMGLKLQLNEQKKNLQTLQGESLADDKLRSPIDGYVFSIEAEKGDYVKEGQDLFYLSPSREKLIVQAYVPAIQGKIIEKGMPAEIVPSFTEALEYGSIKGTVFQVSEYPESFGSMKAILKNNSLVKQFSDLGPVIAIKIALTENKKNFSGLEWTSSHGPHIHFSKGTLANVSILVEKRRPVSFILPRAEKLLHVGN